IQKQKIIHTPTSTLAPSNAQKRSLTARYVVRKLTGSFHKRCATRLRAAPPITIRLNSDPPMAIPKPASNIRTYRATRAPDELTNVVGIFRVRRQFKISFQLRNRALLISSNVVNRSQIAMSFFHLITTQLYGRVEFLFGFIVTLQICKCPPQIVMTDG